MSAIFAGACAGVASAMAAWTDGLSVPAQISFWVGAGFCVPTAFVLLEVLASLIPRRRADAGATLPSTVVLIPAHNEGVILPRILKRLTANTNDQVRIVVIADNCTDDTADLARAAGVEVMERKHPTDRGKPFALAWALEQLAAQPPEAIVILDADCWFEHGDPSLLAQLACKAGRPMQGIYRMKGRSLRDFAFRFRGNIRLRGLSALGGYVPLCGSGFAIPWPLLERVPVPLGELTEDTVWGWQFSMAGLGVKYTSETEVVSLLPQSASGMSVQQHRWEYGVVSATMRYLPRLFRSALLPPKPRLIMSLLDLMVPPLALLVLSILLTSGIGCLFGGFRAAATGVLALAMLTFAVGCGWFFYARKDIAFTTLLKAPWYALRKIGFYLSFLTRHRGEWTRTDRDES